MKLTRTAVIIFITILSSYSPVLAQFEIDSLKLKWMTGERDSIEGIYTLSSKSRSYELALAKAEGFYKLIYLEGDQKNWLTGDLKAMIVSSGNGIYEGRWNAGMPNSPLLEDVKIAFGDKKFILYWPDWTIDEFRMTYPEKASTQIKTSRKLDDKAFERKFSSVSIQKSDSGLVEIPVTINDVLKIYVKLAKTGADVELSKDIAQTLIQTKTLGFNEWEEGNYFEFIDASKPFRQPHEFIIRTLKIGNEELNDVRAVILSDLTQTMRINIGLLRKIGNVNIDLEKELLIITKK